MTKSVSNIDRQGLRAFYAKPITQVFMIAMTCFCCPGLFNALSGIGGGGQVSADASNKGSIALYSAFSVTSFFSGTINNKLGSRLTLSIGGSGYALYIASFLSFNINGNSNFVIAAGAILGICAGCLWTAQGSMCLAYATENTKGRLFALFWAVFNCGAVLGSVIELGLTYNSQAPRLGNGVYIVFLVLSTMGATIPAFLVNPGTMVRTDGSRVVVPVHPSWKHEFIGLFKCLKLDWLVVLLFPAFLASNWMYAYQFNDYNGSLFNIRTRALNSLLYWFFQIFGAFGIGAALDSSRFRRITRAWAGLCFVFVLSMAVWGGTFKYAKMTSRSDVGVVALIDLKDSGYAGRVVVYIWMGILDACWQNYIYWTLGSMTNDAAHLAYLVGYYKSIQSIGSVATFRMDLNGTSFIAMMAVSWGLMAGSALLIAPLIYLRVTDHTESELLRDGKDSASLETSVEVEAAIDDNKEKV